MGMPCHTHDGVKLEILPTLIEAFPRHLSFCRRKAFYEDGYNKTKELPITKEILFLDLIHSKIWPLNWV